MANKTSKASTSSKEVAKNQEKKDFLSFYDSQNREKLMPIFRITDPTGKKVVCELEFSSIMKWNRDQGKADWSYVNLRVSKPLSEGGKMGEVIKFTFGHSDKKNSLWVMKTKPEQEEEKPLPVESI